MATIATFNEMMEQFLTELIQTFPDEKAIKKYFVAFDMARKSNARMCMQEFMNSIGPYSQQIMARDESFFIEHNDEIPFVNELNLKTHWNEDLSENTKNAIWQYLQTLYLMGMTISSLPEETLTMIETVAKQCAMNLGEGGLNEQALLSGMSGLMSTLGAVASTKKSKRSINGPGLV
jgi:hypothetical protein